MASLIFNICVVLSWLIANYLMHNQFPQRPHKVRIFNYILLLEFYNCWFIIDRIEEGRQGHFIAIRFRSPFLLWYRERGMNYFSSNTNLLFVMKEFNCFDRLWSFCVCNEGPQTALYSCGGVCIVCPGGRMDYVVDNSFLWSLIFLWQRAYIHEYPAKTGSDFPLIIHQLFFNALCGSC